MKKAKHEKLRSEYQRKDLGPGIRGKYYQSYEAGTNLVLLNPEVAAAFPTERAVNEALSSLIKVARRSAGLPKRLPRTRNRSRTG